MRRELRAKALADVELVPIAIPVEPEERAPEPLSAVAEPAGSPTGSDHGDPEGIDRGQVGGQVGGSPTGMGIRPRPASGPSRGRLARAPVEFRIY